MLREDRVNYTRESDECSIANGISAGTMESDDNWFHGGIRADVDYYPPFRM